MHKTTGACLLLGGLAGVSLLLTMPIAGGQNTEDPAAAPPPLGDAPVLERRIDPQADRIVRAMSDYLKSVRAFTFRADVTYERAIKTGQLIEFGGVSDVSVRRPDGLHSEYHGDERKTHTVYDGQTFSLLNLVTNHYAVVEAPPTIDEAVDHVSDALGVTVPIADFVYEDPYDALMEHVDRGFFVGKHVVDGTVCNHLAFSQAFIDWQLWVEDGTTPLPRKFVINYKVEPGSPQYSARLMKWNLKPAFPHNRFKFDPPKGADEIEFLPPSEPETEEEVMP